MCRSSRSRSSARTMDCRASLSSGKLATMTGTSKLCHNLPENRLPRHLFAVASRGSLIARNALQLRHVDPIEDHRQLTGSQLHGTCPVLQARQLENPRLEALVPQYVSVPVPHENL